MFKRSLLALILFTTPALADPNAIPANEVMASPSGGPGPLSPRVLVGADLPPFSLTVGTTISGSCTNGFALYNNAGVLGCQSAAGGGNVSSTGTPTNGQVGVWTSATILSGVTPTGTGSPVFSASPTLTGTTALTNAALSGTLGVTGQTTLGNLSSTGVTFLANGTWTQIDGTTSPPANAIYLSSTGPAISFNPFVGGVVENAEAYFRITGLASPASTANYGVVIDMTCGVQATLGCDALFVDQYLVAGGGPTWAVAFDLVTGAGWNAATAYTLEVDLQRNDTSSASVAGIFLSGIIGATPGSAAISIFPSGLNGSHFLYTVGVQCGASAFVVSQACFEDNSNAASAFVNNGNHVNATIVDQASTTAASIDFGGRRTSTFGTYIDATTSPIAINLIGTYSTGPIVATLPTTCSGKPAGTFMNSSGTVHVC